MSPPAAKYSSRMRTLRYPCALHVLKPAQFNLEAALQVLARRRLPVITPHATCVQFILLWPALGYRS